MAIPYARAELIQRSRGHSTIERVAYVMRTRAVSDRTGKSYDFSHYGDYLAGTVLLPNGAVPVRSAIELCTGLEMASNRKDAALGFELVLALPTPEEQAVETSQAMAEQFIRNVIVEKHGLTAIVALHSPHKSEQEFEMDALLLSVGEEDSFATAMAMSAVNLHVHALISPRQRTPHGWSSRRYTALDPVNRNGKTYGRKWGRLWGNFQNTFFAGSGSDLRVTPNPPVSLTPAPLRLVRGWRAKKRTASGTVDGRELLVNQSREYDNTEAALKIDGMLQSLKAPFTRNELNRFFMRHLPGSLGLEAADAAIGLGCVALSTPEGSGEWYASVGLVHHEMAAIGRGLILAERFLGQREVSHLVVEGFTQSTSTVLANIFSGPDLVIVKTENAADALAGDLAGLAKRVGLRAVSIASPAGHPLPQSIVVEAAALTSKMVSDALIILDDPDALVAAELSLVLAAAVAGNNKLVVVRRADSDWAQLELIDLIAEHAPVLEWQPLDVSHPRTGVVQERTPIVPRTAITFAPQTKPNAPNLGGWPRFGVDFDGQVITSKSSMAVIMRMLASVPDELEWAFPNNDKASDEALLLQRLEAWFAEETMMASVPGDSLDAEHAAFDSLDAPFDQADDDSFDVEQSWETGDHDEEWSEEHSVYDEPDLDEPEV
ncbi:MobA/MobL family protein [Devosia sp. Leaf420]|uniref:MobA/MobL family protein n=1 Tax=Devosia sp. Leaf420 TaxID=1736374 RepID=UPI0007840CC4|nr:MobA/MobL family protein [Devosia sp. Leaf420]